MRAKRETLACFREDRSTVNAHKIHKMANEEPTFSLPYFFFQCSRKEKGLISVVNSKLRTCLSRQQHMMCEHPLLACVRVCV